MLQAENRKRIEALRAAALEAVVCYRPMYLDFFRHFVANGEMPLYQRYTAAYRCAFSRIEPVIDGGELIVGKANRPLTEAEEAEWLQLLPQVEQIVPAVGQDSHMAIDYEQVLQKGLSGIRKDMEARLVRETDPEKQAFYASCAGCLEAVIAHSDAYARHAAALAAAETDCRRREELREIARICGRVPAHPARTFREAVQSVHFISYCLSYDPFRWFSMLQFQLGHPDRYLLPYYQADLTAGRINSENAQLLLDMLAVQINNRVPHGLSSGYMVGGRDADGCLVANELTHMLMECVDDVRLVYPAVGFCYAKGMPEEFLEHACRILSHGRSHPAIFNDDVITRGLTAYGVSERDAHSYIHSTCVEITPCAASNVWVASPYINLAQPLLDTMGEEHASMDSLLRSMFYKLDTRIQKEFLQQNEYRKLRKEKSMNPLLSCFVHDCPETGRDIERGGARYNWIMPSFVGMANLIDSLAAVEQLVFTEKKYTLSRFKTMVDEDYRGFEAERQEILNRLPKYGNGEEAADKWSRIITEHIAAECEKYRPLFGSRLIPSVFCWVMHEILGKETGATPDGRRAGFPLGDGSGPAQGREKKGPTASILSATGWCHEKFIGGVAVNMKFSKKVFDAQSFSAMVTLIKTYLEQGGFEIQINVLDRDTLLAAQKAPEQYRDLLVRIGGYSDYYVRLSPEMQAEVLLRTEHEI